MYNSVPSHIAILVIVRDDKSKYAHTKIRCICGWSSLYSNGQYEGFWNYARNLEADRNSQHVSVAYPNKTLNQLEYMHHCYNQPPSNHSMVFTWELYDHAIDIYNRYYKASEG